MRCLVVLLTLLLLAAAIAVSDAKSREESKAQPSDATVEQILSEQEKLLSGDLPSDPAVKPRTANPDLFGIVRVAEPRMADLDLVGIVTDDRDGNKALFVGPAGGIFVLSVGDSVLDGTLIEINPKLGTVGFRPTSVDDQPDRLFRYKIGGKGLDTERASDDPRIIRPYSEVAPLLVPLSDQDEQPRPDDGTGDGKND